MQYTELPTFGRVFHSRVFSDLHVYRRYESDWKFCLVQRGRRYKHRLICVWNYNITGLSYIFLHISKRKNLFAYIAWINVLYAIS